MDRAAVQVGGPSSGPRLSVGDRTDWPWKWAVAIETAGRSAKLDACAVPSRGCMHEVTRVLSAIEEGEPQAAEQLLPLVYDELRRLAAEKTACRRSPDRRSRPQHSYMRPISDWWTSTSRGTGTSRRHFFAAASEAMRRILVERHDASLARSVAATETDWISTWRTITCPGRSPTRCWPWTRHLSSLAAVDAEAAELVKLRYFAGMSIPEAAEVLGYLPPGRRTDSGPTLAPGFVEQLVTLTDDGGRPTALFWHLAATPC